MHVGKFAGVTAKVLLLTNAIGQQMIEVPVAQLIAFEKVEKDLL